MVTNGDSGNEGFRITDAGINLGKVACPECDERLPALRIPHGLHQILWGGWSCPNCGCRMDKWGVVRNEPASSRN